VLYLPLAFPAVIWVGARTPAAGLAGALAAWALAWGPEDLPLEARSVLTGMIWWGLAAGQLYADAAAAPRGRGALARAFAEPRFAGGFTALAGVLAGGVLVGTQPGDGPRAAPLPEGAAPEGPGFIQTGDRVPGGDTRALGEGMDRAASTLARPGTIRALQEHMITAAAAWEALAERYPAREAELRSCARAVPRGVLKEVSGTEVRAWLRSEREALQRFAAEGLEVSALRAPHEDAWTSGLGEETFTVPTRPGGVAGGGTPRPMIPGPR
jgi:hypothetical protein